MIRSFRAGLAIALGAASLHAALDVSNAGFYRVVSGSARGQGKVFDIMQGTYIEGTWNAGRPIAGQAYRVSHPRKPDKVFEQFYDAEGFLEHGVMLRMVGSTSAGLPHFEGTFQRVYHPFMRAAVSTPAEGVYRNGVGIEYRGSFQYMPAKGTIAGQLTMGYFIFYGDKVDVEDETTETGMYVSEATVSGAQIMFSRADPSYLTVLQENYQRDLQIASGEFRKQDAWQNWGKVFSLLNSVAQITSGQTSMGSSRNQFAIQLVRSVFEQPSADRKPESLKEMALRTLISAGAGKLTDNKELAKKLTNVVVDTLDKPAPAEAAK